VEHLKTFENGGAEKTLQHIKREVDDFVDFVHKCKQDLEINGKFIPWDWQNRYSADSIIQRGYIDVDDSVTFRLQAEALRCFGFAGQTIRRGTWHIRDGSGDWVWFPRLYQHSIWNNELSGDGKIIRGHATTEQGRQKNIQDIEKRTKAISEGKSPENVIVFAKSKDSLGNNVLRYVGTFRVNLSESCADFIQFDRHRTIEKVRL
jgi:hypothetical protein